MINTTRRNFIRGAATLTLIIPLRRFLLPETSNGFQPDVVYLDGNYYDFRSENIEVWSETGSTIAPENSVTIFVDRSHGFTEGELIRVNGQLMHVIGTKSDSISVIQA